LDVLGHSSDQNRPCLWVRERSGVVLTAERALTDPDNLILGQPPVAQGVPSRNGIDLAR
jgi:hypothetical protein